MGQGTDSEDSADPAQNTSGTVATAEALIIVRGDSGNKVNCNWLAAVINKWPLNGKKVEARLPVGQVAFAHAYRDTVESPVFYSRRFDFHDRSRLRSTCTSAATECSHCSTPWWSDLAPASRRMLPLCEVRGSEEVDALLGSWSGSWTSCHYKSVTVEVRNAKVKPGYPKFS